jgi:hypothetical protein
MELPIPEGLAIAYARPSHPAWGLCPIAPRASRCEVEDPASRILHPAFLLLFDITPLS